MGINYYQYAIVGTIIDEEEIRVVTQPEEYEMQNRYDSRTGKVVRQEKVVVKEEEGHLRFCNKDYECIDDIESEFSSKGLTLFYVDDYYILGISILDSSDCGKAELIRGSLDPQDLVDNIDWVSNIIPSCEVKLYLDFYIG